METELSDDPIEDSEEDVVLKGVVRIEQLRQADEYIDALLADVGKDNLKGFEIRVDVTDDGGSHGRQMVPART